MSVKRFVMSDRVLRLIKRQDIMLSFYLERGFECENVLSEITMLDEIFKVLMKGPALRSSVSLVVRNE